MIIEIDWSRASRTDKGVHAVRNVLSMKMELNDPEKLLEEDPLGISVAEDINKHLPENVRVVGVLRTPTSFSARHNCVKRTYQYWLPYELVENSQYSLSDLNQMLKDFVGSFYFHNFTAKWAPKTKLVMINNTNQQTQQLENKNQTENNENLDEQEEDEDEEGEGEDKNETNEKEEEIVVQTQTGKKRLVNEKWGGVWVNSETRSDQIKNWRSPTSLRKEIVSFS